MMSTKSNNNYKNTQSALINHHYTKEAPTYEKIYYMTDEEALKIAKETGKEHEFLPYRNVSLACDEIVKDLETPFIKNCLQRGKHIACFGSGTGDTLRFFPFIPPSHFVGYDIAQGMVEEAQKLHPGYQFFQEDTQNIYLEKDKYGLLISNYGPASYWKNMKQEAKKLYKQLDEKGVVCLGFYSHQVKYGLPFEESTTKEELKKGIHINFYKEQEIKAILKESGFRYIASRGVNFDCTRRAWEIYKKTGRIYPIEYWKREISIWDNRARKKGKDEHWARHFYLFASKKPFELVENGTIIYSSNHQVIFPSATNQSYPSHVPLS